jgi:hypothetical protein
MDITLFGFKMNLELLILIGVVYLILVAHTVGGCCNMPLIMEGLKSMDSSKYNISCRKRKRDRKLWQKFTLPIKVI